VIKVVRPYDPRYIHHYGTGSFSLTGARCWGCGKSIL
jgi:hypothetical protein